MDDLVVFRTSVFRPLTGHGKMRFPERGAREKNLPKNSPCVAEAAEYGRGKRLPVRLRAPPLPDPSAQRAGSPGGGKMSKDQSAELMTRWRNGDQRAADELVRRYTERLLALARSRLSARLTRHIDPEDVLQSAYRSFFVGTRDGRYVLQRTGDLWRLLVAITLHKLHHRVERHTAGKRDITLESPFEGKSTLGDLEYLALAREPSPAEAAALADELELVLRKLEPRQR